MTTEIGFAHGLKKGFAGENMAPHRIRLVLSQFYRKDIAGGI
jgi:hypothetical protein